MSDAGGAGSSSQPQKVSVLFVCLGNICKLYTHLMHVTCADRVPRQITDG